MRDKKKMFFLQGQYRAFARVSRKLKRRDFLAAKSYNARDIMCRVMAAECYELAQEAVKAEEKKLSLQYMKLTAKLLGLSLRPKKLSDLEKIRKAIAKLQAEGSRDARLANSA